LVSGKLTLVLAVGWVGGGGVALKFLKQISLQDNLRSGQISLEVFIMKTSSA
jgi:hypothetical protein